MGLLDDAIREHLELKRRSGADPSEVARQEREALGPARRGPEPLEVPQPPAPAHEEPEDPALIDPQVDAPVYHEPDDVPEYVPPARPPRPEAEPLAEAPPVEPERSAAVPEEAKVDWEAPEREPEHDREPESSARRHTDQETVAFDAADVEDAERRPPRETAEEPAAPPPYDADRDEDVLEETPDFLQETPEHDRLWFEQRPPRDFDFDG
jgi:hypothetical protein